MMRGVVTAWRLLFHGWRWVGLCLLMLAVGLVALGNLPQLGSDHGSANAWDALIFGGVTRQTFALLMVPAFLIGTSRDLYRPWESQVWLRLRSRSAWWGTDVVALGAAALVYALAIGMTTMGFGWTAVPLAWGWSGVARSILGVPSAPPWVVSVETLALLALGLWVLGVLARVLAMALHSQWYGLALTWSVVLVQYALTQFGFAQIVPWTPGDQFLYLLHVTSSGSRFPISWSVAYGGILLAVAIAGGGMVVHHREWSA